MLQERAGDDICRIFNDTQKHTRSEKEWYLLLSTNCRRVELVVLAPVLQRGISIIVMYRLVMWVKTSRQFSGAFTYLSHASYVSNVFDG